MRPLLLVVPDGAADPLGEGTTCLEEARTPALDRLAGRGGLQRVRTIPAHLPAGTEAGLATLLGLALEAAPARGRLEAAALDVALAEDEGAWRLDLLAGRRPVSAIDDGDVARLDEAVRELGGRVLRLRGHRLLLIGPSWWGDAPPGPHQTDRPLHDLAVGPFGAVAKAARTALRARAGRSASPLVAWPWGALGTAAWPDLPARLGRPVVVVARTGAAVGLARLLRCDVADSVPDPPPDGALVVVHIPDPDDAAHARDRVAKVAAIERVDALVGDLSTVGADLAVCPDHGTDPATGAHTAAPVPGLLPGGAGAAVRLTERAAAALPVVDGARFLAPLLAQEALR